MACKKKYFASSYNVQELERDRVKDFKFIKEYKHYYLYGKYKDGKLLYKECFSKFDIDGVVSIQPVRQPYKRFNIWNWR